MGFVLALSGFIIVMGAAVHYLMIIARERVPVSVWPYGALFGGGAIIAMLGALLAPGIITIGLATMAVTTGIFLIWLLGQRKMPAGKLIVCVGDVMPELVAPNQDGKPVNIADLRGQRILLKFFRGSW